VEGAKVDNSAFNLTKDLADIKVPESPLEKGLGECYSYSAVAGTSSTPFQIPQKRANDNVDSLVFLDWPGEGAHIWALLRKKRIEKIVFGSEYNRAFCTPSEEHTLNWADYILQPDPIEKFRSVSKETVNRIKRFAYLGDNWDSYGAKAIEWSTIIKAIDFFSIVVSRFPDAPLPFVAPAGNGDIHFEWEKCSRVLKHSIPEDENDPFEYLLIDKTSGKVERTYRRALNMDEMVGIALYWMR